MPTEETPRQKKHASQPASSASNPESSARSVTRRPEEKDVHLVSPPRPTGRVPSSATSPMYHCARPSEVAVRDRGRASRRGRSGQTRARAPTPRANGAGRTLSPAKRDEAPLVTPLWHAPHLAAEETPDAPEHRARSNHHRRDRGWHLPDQHASRGGAGRLHVKTVPRGRCRAAPLPHGTPDDLSGGPRRDRAGHAGHAATLDRVL